MECFSECQDKTRQFWKWLSREQVIAQNMIGQPDSSPVAAHV